MIEEPINYHREEEVVEDDDPGLPYFPNNPASLRFYPLYIPQTDDNTTKVLAPYIYYCNNYQEVVGCMKRGAPPYGAPVYLHTPNPVQLPIPLTNTQIRQFTKEDPWAYTIDKVLQRLEDLRIDAKVSRLREKLDLQTKIHKQLDDVRRQERRLVGAQFDVEQTIDTIRDCMERVHLYQTLADAYARMVVRPTASPSDRPLGLRARGPLKCPNYMMNLATVVAGSVEAALIAASSAQSIDAQTDSVHIARVIVTEPHSVCSKDSTYLRHANVPPPKHSHTHPKPPRGVASAYATTQDTRRWTAPQGSFAIIAGSEVTSIS